MLPIIENYSENHERELAQLLFRHSREYPDAKIQSAEFYTSHPTFEGGKNIFCALDKKGKLLAFAPLFPIPVDDNIDSENPHIIWTAIIVDSKTENEGLIKDILLEKIYYRAGEIKKSLSKRDVLLAIDCFFNHGLEMAYYISKGFLPYQTRYQMARSLLQSIPLIESPLGINVSKCEINLETEQRKYLKAYNQAFPQNPQTIENLKNLISLGKSEFRVEITTLNKENEIIGGITVSRSKEETQNQVGLIEDVFVLPSWRRRGIAKYLISKGLLYLRDNGITEARLEVLAQNEAALKLYKGMGYKVLNKELILGVYLLTELD